MIKKILSINAVGLFNQNFRAVEFQKVSIIYGENGRGKSTLSAVLRSLCSCDPKYILERRTLGSLNQQEVRLVVDPEQNIIFSKGNWNKTLPEMVVFDSVFVDNNIYSGSSIDINHRRNLHHFVVGEEGVNLANEVESLDERIKEKTDEISKQESEIQKHIIGKRFKISDFLDLQFVENIQKCIEINEIEIDSLTRAKEIISKSDLKKIILPEIPKKQLKEILLKNLDEISRDAEKIMQEHIASCMDKKGEEWIENGIHYIKENKCPFCGHNILEVDLIKTYKSYFSSEYNSLKKYIKNFSQEMENRFSESGILLIQEIFASNNSLRDFWANYIKLEQLQLSFEEIRTAWSNLRLHLLLDLKRKESNPLESISLSIDLQSALADIDNLINRLNKYNEDVGTINLMIAQKKKATEQGNLEESKFDLERLRNVEKRFSYDINKICEIYKSNLAQKKKLVEEKDEAKRKLDTYTSTILSSYETALNEHLARCGAGFKIGESKTTYLGGKPSASYRLLINDVAVDLGSAKSSAESANFKNTLSEGDKSTLAFIFFISKLERDPNLSRKIIVFDDPVSSLDGNRRSFTAQQIIRISGQCEQVIILTHDMHFARQMWNDVREVKCTLQIKRSGVDSVIEKWDLMADTRGEYFRNYDYISDFLKNGPKDDNHLRAVARCIRPLIEGNLRMRFPGIFRSEEWLGDFLDKIRSAQKGDPLFPLKTIYKDISDINDYSKKYHHNQNPGADYEPITDTELRTYSELTLRVITGTG